MKKQNLKIAIEKVFSNRKTPNVYPVAFTKEFFEDPETNKRWKNLLSSLGKEQLDFKIVIKELSEFFNEFLF